MICQQCKTEYAPKQKFCCDNCRKRYFRKGKIKTPITPEHINEPTPEQRPERKGLDWRDEKGQCQHKSKTCTMCFR